MQDNPPHLIKYEMKFLPFLSQDANIESYIGYWRHILTGGGEYCSFILLFPSQRYSILFHTILLYTFRFSSLLFSSLLFSSILFYSILFYSILFYSILFYSILFQTFDKSFENWERWQNICVQILEQICTESCEIKQQQY